jgi:hypothetical protein
MEVLRLGVEEHVARQRRKRGWGVRGRLLLKLVRGVFIEVWCSRIGVRGGVFLLSGSVFEAEKDEHASCGLIWSLYDTGVGLWHAMKLGVLGRWIVGVEIWEVFVLAFYTRA